AIRLPYDDKTLAMVIVLPDEIGGLGAIGNRLGTDEVGKLSSALRDEQRKPVDLALPRFKASFGASLVPVFVKLGLTKAFRDSADFSGMTGRPPSAIPIAIGEIMHRATIEVSEEGTEAAASTAVVITSRSIGQKPKSESFRVDRPSLFSIID